MKTLFTALSGLALAASLAAGATADPTFTGVTTSGALLTIDGATGLGTQTGSLAAGITPGGVAALGTDLFVFDTTTDDVDRVDHYTGATLQTYDIGLSGLSGAGGLTFASDGTGYLSAPLTTSGAPDDGIYSFNLGAGTSTLLGTASDSLEALTFGPGGTLYGLGQGDADLYSVSTTDGSLTSLGLLSPDGGTTFVGAGTSTGGLAFGPDGTLYAAADDALYTVGLTPTVTTDGSFLTTTLINSAQTGNGVGIGYPGVSGLAVPAAVPEPAPLALLALGLLPVGLLVRRRSALRTR